MPVDVSTVDRPVHKTAGRFRILLIDRPSDIFESTSTIGLCPHLIINLPEGGMLILLLFLPCIFVPTQLQPLVLQSSINN